MATAFFIFLLVIWITVVLPGAERARRQTPLPQTQSFQRSVYRLARAPVVRRGRSPKPDAGRSESQGRAARKAFRRAQRRRRRLLGVCIGLCAGSLAAAAVLGGLWVELHLLLDAALLFYIAALLDTKRRREQPRTNVYRLPRREQVEAETLEVAAR